MRKTVKGRKKKNNCAKIFGVNRATTFGVKDFYFFV
jgi:hypothetical protein